MTKAKKATKRTTKRHEYTSARVAKVAGQVLAWTLPRNAVLSHTIADAMDTDKAHVFAISGQDLKALAGSALTQARKAR
jgi:hypothetical protein